MTALGFRIEPNAPLIAPDLIEAYAQMVTSHISDSINRIAGTINLKPMHGRGKLVGTALTVKVRTGDNLMLHKALQMAADGHVIVVDGGGDVSRALTGELMARTAISKGVRGFVLDGAVRDVQFFREGAFPCYARSVTHRGPYKEGPGEINVPVCIDGLVINPGDLVVGDEDGIVAIPAEEATEVLALARAKRDAEARIIDSIENGTMNRAWIDDLLRQKGAIV
jgi:RraA family protein